MPQSAKTTLEQLQLGAQLRQVVGFNASIGKNNFGTIRHELPPPCRRYVSMPQSAKTTLEPSEKEPFGRELVWFQCLNRQKQLWNRQSGMIGS